LPGKILEGDSTVAKTMRAAVVHEFGKPLNIEEVFIPKREPGGPDQSDRERGAPASTRGPERLASQACAPLIPGHEGVGIVVAVGPGVTRFKEGDAAGVAWLHDSCGWCEYCRTGWDARCPAQRNSGYTVHGSFAEHVIGSAPYIGRLPKNPDFVAMAPILCAGVTT